MLLLYYRLNHQVCVRRPPSWGLQEGSRGLVPKREQLEDKNPKNLNTKKKEFLGFLSSSCSRFGFTHRPLIWLLGRRSPDANLVGQTVCTYSASPDPGSSSAKIEMGLLGPFFNLMHSSSCIAIQCICTKIWQCFGSSMYSQHLGLNKGQQGQHEVPFSS